MGTLRTSIALALACVSSMALADGTDDAARLHFQVGQAYYDEANYSDALKEFREAYRLSKKPALHYNVALCYERLGKLDEAVQSLEQYLAEQPTADDRAIVEQRIANLKQARAARAQASPPATSPAPASPSASPASPTSTSPASPTSASPASSHASLASSSATTDHSPAIRTSFSPEPSHVTPPPTRTSTSAELTREPPTLPRKRLYTWIVGGVGLGLLSGALASGIVAQLAYNQLNNKCSMAICDPTTYPSASSDLSRGRSAQIATDVLWPLGVVAEGVATALFFLEGKRARTHHADLVPIFLPSGAGAALSSKW